MAMRDSLVIYQVEFLSIGQYWSAQILWTALQGFINIRLTSTAAWPEFVCAFKFGRTKIWCVCVLPSERLFFMTSMTSVSMTSVFSYWLLFNKIYGIKAMNNYDNLKSSIGVDNNDYKKVFQSNADYLLAKSGASLNMFQGGPCSVRSKFNNFEHIGWCRVRALYREGKGTWAL